MDNGTLTLGQFIAESENFQYSKTFYELIKESSELALMEMYVDTTDYLVENAVEVTEGVEFMVEAAVVDKAKADAKTTEDGDGAKNKVNELTSKINTKKNGLFGKIGNMFKTAWKAIMAFFGRITNLWTNSQGKEIAKLRAEAKEAKEREAQSKFNETEAKRDLKNAEGWIKEFSNKLADAEDNISVLTKNLSGANDEIAAYNTKFKDIDPALYRELQKVVVLLKDSYTIRTPKIVSRIDDVCKRTGEIVKMYSKSKSAIHNKDSAIKVAQQVATLRNDIKQSRVQFEDTEINASKLNSTKKSLEDQYAKMEAEFNKLAENMDNADKKPEGVNYDNDIVKGIRKSTADNFGKLSQDLSFLLSEFKGANSAVIKLLSKHIQERSDAIKLQKQLLGKLAS